MTIKTVRMKASEISKDWHVVDAADRPLGRLASEVAQLLRGKHKPTYEPHLDGGDFVIVINASQIRLSGGKSAEKVYYTHSGYPGGLKARSFTEQLARHPNKVIEDAVWGMLPKGPLGKKMLRHLKVYAGPTHPHESQMTGSERAKSAREAALAEKVLVERKPARLRPLAVPQQPEVDVLELYPEAEAAVEAPAPKPKRSPLSEPTALPADQSGASAQAELKPENVADVAPPEATEAKPRRTRKKAEAPAATDETTPETNEQSETEE